MTAFSWSPRVSRNCNRAKFGVSASHVWRSLQDQIFNTCVFIFSSHSLWPYRFAQNRKTWSGNVAHPIWMAIFAKVHITHWKSPNSSIPSAKVLTKSDILLGLQGPWTLEKCGQFDLWAEPCWQRCVAHASVCIDAVNRKVCEVGPRNNREDIFFSTHFNAYLGEGLC